jgi:hypothetical protein
MLTDATGIPLAVGLSAASTHDSLLLEELVDTVPAVIGPGVGRASARPNCVKSSTRLGRHR